MIPSEILSKWCIVCTSYKWLSSIFLEMSNKIPLKTHVFVYASNSKVGMVIDSCHLRRKHIFLSCLIADKSRTLSPQVDNKQPFSRLQWTANITTLKMEVTECSKILHQNTGYNLSAHKGKKLQNWHHPWHLASIQIFLCLFCLMLTNGISSKN